jgi:hypothetical protein
LLPLRGEASYGAYQEHSEMKEYHMDSPVIHRINILMDQLMILRNLLLYPEKFEGSPAHEAEEVKWHAKNLEPELIKVINDAKA